MNISQPAKPRRTRRRKDWRQADHEGRRRLIVDVATDLVRARGVQAATMRAVAATLGIGTMTLYTYIARQEDLHREITRRGFDLLHERCEAASTLGTTEGWRGGSRSYIQFAVENPNLYKLMFDTPLRDHADSEILSGGFQTLVTRVRQQLEARGMVGEALDQHTTIAAGRFWIALHGLAMLAIAGRLSVLGHDVDTLLDDLLKYVSPT